MDWNRIEARIFEGIFAGVLQAYSGSAMRQQRDVSKTKTEDHYFRQFLDDLAPTEPLVKIYRIEPNGKQVCLDYLFLETMKSGVLKLPGTSQVLRNIRDQFGPGKYLLRTVYSNGRFGPSRVVHIG